VLSRISGETLALDLALWRSSSAPNARPVRAPGPHYNADASRVLDEGARGQLEVAGRVNDGRENRRRSILEDARARGVEFHASGTEPGWVL